MKIVISDGEEQVTEPVDRQDSSDLAGAVLFFLSLVILGVLMLK